MTDYEIFTADVGSFVRVIGEPGLYCVEEDRGERLLLRGLVDLPIQPTRAVFRTDVRVVAAASELTDEETSLHAAELRANCGEGDDE